MPSKKPKVSVYLDEDQMELVERLRKQRSATQFFNELLALAQRINAGTAILVETELPNPASTQKLQDALAIVQAKTFFGIEQEIIRLILHDAEAYKTGSNQRASAQRSAEAMEKILKELEEIKNALPKRSETPGTD